MAADRAADRAHAEGGKLMSFQCAPTREQAPLNNGDPSLLVSPGGSRAAGSDFLTQSAGSG
jgi:hypothetical protein